MNIYAKKESEYEYLCKKKSEYEYLCKKKSRYETSKNAQNSVERQNW